jgi:hypothetical protein
MRALAGSDQSWDAADEIREIADEKIVLLKTTGKNKQKRIQDVVTWVARPFVGHSLNMQSERTD